jgi:hypothetical protein
LRIKSFFTQGLVAYTFSIVLFGRRTFGCSAIGSEAYGSKAFGSTSTRRKKTKEVSQRNPEKPSHGYLRTYKINPSNKYMRNPYIY